ncbi:hypothetical protein PM082_015337 [Marasmius tenuissimus]|nr:hypothetical protein PM082_015337 [Marasmius tenuissimus]
MTFNALDRKASSLWIFEDNYPKISLVPLINLNCDSEIPTGSTFALYPGKSLLRTASGSRRVLTTWKDWRREEVKGIKTD